MVLQKPTLRKSGKYGITLKIPVCLYVDDIALAIWNEYVYQELGIDQNCEPGEISNLLKKLSKAKAERCIRYHTIYCRHESVDYYGLEDCDNEKIEKLISPVREWVKKNFGFNNEE